MKVKVENRVILDDGTVVLNDDAILSSLYVDSNLPDNVAAVDSDTVAEYNRWAKIYDLPSIPTEINGIDHEYRKTQWNIPVDVQELDIEQFLLNKCETEIARTRVEQELIEYKKNDLFALLRFLVYFVEQLRKNGVLWGIGRGSSVSSYVLYLIGVHRIDSIKYDLDMREFFKQ